MPYFGVTLISTLVESIQSRNCFNVIKIFFQWLRGRVSSSSFGEVSTPCQTQTRLGLRVYYYILLLPQAAILPGSDAGSDVVKPALDFVIQNCQTLCSMRCQCIRHIVRIWSAVCSKAPHSD